MNINYKQPQFELFPGNSPSVDETKKPRIFLASLTLSIENLVVLLILGIMSSVFAYSMGVERGKSIMALQYRESPEIKSAALIPPTATTPLVKTSTAVQAPVNAKAAVSRPQTPATNMAVTTTAKPVVNEMKVKPQTPGNYKYTIQVASYKDQKFAHKEAVNLKQGGFETLVMQKGKYAILCVGKFSQKSEANSVLSKLKSKYKDSLVRSM